MTICIAVSGRGRAPTTFVYDMEEVRLGRSSSNDIVFDPIMDGAVSRRHAVIKRLARGKFSITDLNSTQGTYLNKQRVHGEAPLRSGDVLILGVDGPTVTVVWESSDESTDEMEKLLRRVSPSVFPMALYRDFPERFQIYQKIGEGGYGEVWRARALDSADWVAVKFLRPELLVSSSSGSSARVDKLVARFMREAEVTRLLSEGTTAGIAKVYEAGGEPDEGFLYMMLEYVEGRSLDRIISKHEQLPEGSVCRYMRQVAESLHAAHEFEWLDPDTGREMSGIIHRDIKPSNIIIRKRDRRAILVDFGIAAIEEGGDRLTLPQMRVFTYKFTAPEVLVDNTISLATDLWGLAVTMYVMLTGGYFPYSGMGLAETIRNIREHKMTPIHTHRPDLSPALVALLDRALHPDGAERPQTAGEWVEALEPLSNPDHVEMDVSSSSTGY